MWISNIYTSMAPSLKQMQINIPGCGKKPQKNPDTVSLIRLLHSLRKSMKNCHVRAFAPTGTGRNKGVPLSAAILTLPPRLTIGKDRNLSWK